MMTEPLTRARRRVDSVLCRRWHLDRVLGGGDTSVVYAGSARERRKRLAAIRVLHPEFSADDVIRARFFREGYLGNEVPHPATVRTITHGQAEDGSAFLVMDLVPGQTLRERVARGPLPLTEALCVADQLLDVLVSAHANGITHRGLAPHHLILEPSGRVRVLDFGGARLRDVTSGSGRVGSFSGPIGYAPPEQVRGCAAPDDPRCDLHAVGAILYHLLCGRRMHEAVTSSEQIARTISAPPPSIVDAAPHLPPSVVAVVDTALRYLPEERWPDAPTMQRALRQAIPELSPHDAPALQARRRPSAPPGAARQWGAAPEKQLALGTGAASEPPPSTEAPAERGRGTPWLAALLSPERAPRPRRGFSELAFGAESGGED